MCPAAIRQSGQEGSPIAVGMATTATRLDFSCHNIFKTVVHFLHF